MRLALADDDFREARSFSPAGPAPFASGEALALASAMRFGAVRHASMTARDLDDALCRLSTRHLQALLSLEQHSRPMFQPPAPVQVGQARQSLFGSSGNTRTDETGSNFFESRARRAP